MKKALNWGAYSKRVKNVSVNSYVSFTQLHVCAGAHSVMKKVLNWSAYSKRVKNVSVNTLNVCAGV